VLGTLTALPGSSRDREGTCVAKVASRKSSSKTFDLSLADFWGEVEGHYFTVKLLFPQLKSKGFKAPLSFFL